MIGRRVMIDLTYTWDRIEPPVVEHGAVGTVTAVGDMVRVEFEKPVFLTNEDGHDIYLYSGDYYPSELIV